jgi:hypothetical protein
VALVPDVEEADATGVIKELMSVVDYFNGSNAIASGLTVEYTPPVLADGVIR